jgi:hypothetical protein
MEMAVEVWEIVSGGFILNHVLEFVKGSIQKPCQT